MPLAPYTTPALVRSNLGVAAMERPDEEIDTSSNSTNLFEALYEVSTTLPDDLLAAINAPSPTTTRFRNLGQLYCDLTVALFEVISVEMFAPRVIKDDRTQLERIDDPFKHLAINLAATQASVQRRLKEAYAAAYPSAVFNVVVGADIAEVVGVVSSPATDIVTNV